MKVMTFIGYVPSNPTFTVIHICTLRMNTVLPCYVDLNLSCNEVVISLDRNLFTLYHTYVDTVGNYFFTCLILSLIGPSMAPIFPSLDCHAVLHVPRAHSLQTARSRSVFVNHMH